MIPRHMALVQWSPPTALCVPAAPACPIPERPICSGAIGPSELRWPDRLMWIKGRTREHDTHDFRDTGNPMVKTHPDPNHWSNWPTKRVREKEIHR